MRGEEWESRERVRGKEIGEAGTLRVGTCWSRRVPARDPPPGVAGGYLAGPPERVDVTLIDQARDALASAYAPYSEYAVGAAIETKDGTVYTGCNVENANYSNSLHAEEVALGGAISDGHRDFARLAVTSTARDGLTPCGMCRQTLSEFCDGAFPVLCDHGETVDRYTLGELLPKAISGEDLRRDRR